MIPFKDVKFLTSALYPAEFPNLKDSQGKLLPDIALVGRSNVGKSSLLNSLFQKKLVKTSATPGKTQRINFFIADEKLLVVDLPGYGYSKAPIETVEEWGRAIDAYLNERKTLRLILLLVDIRRGAADREQMMIEWAQAKNIPLLVVFTKTDTVSPAEKEKALRSLSKEISTIGFSSKELWARKALIHELNKKLSWD
ncbi:MAG TPA: ribosome biogenesis GTP-binding protein YihA/YsxC [Chlamydiales bacterium]|jgi:GTP-binding protein